MHAQQQERFRHSMVQADAHRAQKNGEPVFEVHASSVVRASLRQAWGVLTDYERLPEFVPDLVSSQLISRTRCEAIIEQRSKAGFLFLSRPVHLKLRIVEQPFSSIDVSLLAGDMKHYSARWELEPVSQHGLEGTRISFASTLEPDFFMPPLIGATIVQVNVRKMVEAVATQIERRGAH